MRFTSIKWNNTGKALKIHNKHSTNVSYYCFERNRNIKLSYNCDLFLWQLILPLWSVCRPLLKSCVIQYLLLYWSLFEDLLWFSQAGTQSSHNTILSCYFSNQEHFRDPSRFKFKFKFLCLYSIQCINDFTARSHMFPTLTL